jgi:hydrogenase maturation protease
MGPPMPDTRQPPLLIIGVGNPFRGDDAAGLLAVRQLHSAGLASAQIVEHSGEGASLMEAWKGARAVILIDAVNSGGRPGTICRLDPANKPLPAERFQGSTHAFSIPQAIEMARALNELPAQVVIFGIEGKNFHAGTELSKEVNDALPELVRHVLEEAASIETTLRNGE